MTKLAPLAAALLLGAASLPAAAQDTGVRPGVPAAGVEVERPEQGPETRRGPDYEREYEAQDALTPPPPPGWESPAAGNAPATSVGRQYGAPAGDALARPANPAAVAEEDADEPGLTVAPEMMGDGAQGGDTVIVDEPPMRELNESGTAATSSKIGIGPAPTDEAEDSAEEDRERLGEMPAEIDVQPAWKPVDDPPHPDPSK